MAASIRRSVQLYYDVISPHAWITFEQLFKYRSSWDLDVILKPFSLVGVLVAANKGYPGDMHVKLELANKDVEQIGKHYGIPIKIPAGGYEKVFRRGTLTAMKLLIATEQTKPELTVKLSRSLWMRMWSKDEDITERISLIQAGKEVGVPERDMEYLLLKSKEKCTTVRMRTTTEEALLNGVFTAPTMIVGDDDNKPRVLSGADGMQNLAVLLGKKYESPITNRDQNDGLTSSNTQYDSASSSLPGKDDRMAKPS